MVRDDIQHYPTLSQAQPWTRYYRGFCQVTKNTADAADLYQEFLLKLHSNWPRVQQADSFWAYVGVAFRNLALDWSRAQGRRPEQLLDEHNELCEWEASTPHPDQIIDRERWRAQVRKALESLDLNERERMLLSMLQRQDESSAELALELAISPEAFRQASRRLRVKLCQHPELRDLYQQAPG
jgi:RNA polymerase sigma factor (sigma-70 family)